MYVGINVWIEMLNTRTRAALSIAIVEYEQS